MKKIPLTIKTNYLSSWRAQEGIRELMQNAKDADSDGYPMKVDWYDNRLRISNEGTVLPHSALLLGFTTKENRSDRIGKFGEGLKLGILALIRNGHEVKIRSGSEVWIPSLERSELFDGEEVLCFTIHENRKNESRVRVEVSNIDKEEWERMRPNFLFLSPLPKTETISTRDGSLLLSPEAVGKVFVKGIFIQRCPDLNFGFDLNDAELDRDRKMVDSYSLQSTVTNIFKLAVNKTPDLFSKYMALLESPSLETENVAYNTYDISPELASFVGASFAAKYGADAVPVESLAESADLEHLGKKGIVVSRPLARVLALTVGTSKDIAERLRQEVTTTLGWSELSAVQQSNLNSAIDMLNEGLRVVEGNDNNMLDLSMVEVVKFRSAALQGQFKDGKALLSIAILDDLRVTLQVLVHEIAHRVGADGDKSHVSRIEELWSGIVSHLLSR